MMTIPAVGKYKDITIFPDDENVNYYYCIRETPVLRKQNGIPVFTATFWTNNTPTSAADAVKLSGGAINFDVNLGFTEEEINSIKTMIEGDGIRNNRITQLRSQMQSASLHRQDTVQHYRYNYVLDKGSIEIRPVMYTESTLEVKEQAGGAEVLWKSDGKTSSLGDNNAAFAMTLSAVGAENWYRCLQDDSRPIAIAFHLSYKVRITGISMHIHAAHYSQTEIKGKMKWWTKCNKKPDYSEISRSLIDSGIITITIEKGNDTIPQEYIDKIWQSLFSIVEKKVQQIFEEKYESMSVEDFEKNKETNLFEDMSSFIDIDYTQSDVMTITNSPQANLSQFVSGLTGENRKQAVHLIDLRDPALKPYRTVQFSVDAPWDYVGRVVIDAKCGDEVSSFSFIKDTQPQTWTLKVDTDDVKKTEYTSMVYFKNVSMDKPVVLEKRSCLGNVHVDVGHIGKIDLEFQAYPDLDNLKGDSKVNKLDLNIVYPNLENEFSTYTMPLDWKNATGKHFTQIIPMYIEKPLKFTAVYEFEGCKPITTDEKIVYPSELVSTNPIYVPRPFKDSLDIDVSIPPMSPSSGVKRVTVDFKYEDPKNAFSSADSVTLSSDNDFKSVRAQLPVVDKDLVDFEYQYIIEGNQFFQSPWIKGKGEADRLIIAAQLVRVSCAALKIGELFKMGLLTVTSKDNVINVSFPLGVDTEMPSNGMLEFFTDDMNREYDYTLTVYDMDNYPHEGSGSWKGALFMVPVPKSEEGSC